VSPEQVVALARDTLMDGPYAAIEAREVEGPSDVMRARAVAYADPLDDLVLAQVWVDLGDGQELDPLPSIYSKGHILEPDATGAWVALDVAGLGSTILAPVLWLTGAVSCQSIGEGRHLVTVSVAEMIARAPELARDQVESALSMAQLDLLTTFDVTLTVDSGQRGVAALSTDIDWSEVLPDGARDHMELTLSLTERRAIAIPETIGSMPVERFMMILTAMAPKEGNGG
jgi:hypothetical protein